MSDLSIRMRNYYAERKLPTWGEIRDVADEIDRLQEAKRAALKLADERAKEANELRDEVVRLRRGLKEIVDFVDPLPRAVVREACAELLIGKPKP